MMPTPACAQDEQRASADPASRQPLRQANAEPSSLALAREEDQRSPLALAALLLTDCYGGVITEAAAPWIQLGLSETTRFRSTPTNGPSRAADSEPPGPRRISQSQ